MSSTRYTEWAEHNQPYLKHKKNRDVAASAFNFCDKIINAQELEIDRLKIKVDSLFQTLADLKELEKHLEG